jgi:hypothetical protein
MLHATIANILYIFRWVTLLAVDQQAPMPLHRSHQGPDKPDGLRVFAGYAGPVGRERFQLQHPVHGHDGVDLVLPAVRHATVAKHQRSGRGVVTGGGPYLFICGFSGRYEGCEPVVRYAPSAIKVCDVAIARLQCNPMSVG